MVQSSGPISQGSNAERQMTDVLWRDLFGDEPGVVGDSVGTAYYWNVTAESGNIVQIGSLHVDSLARVAGFAHRIPMGQLESIEIPDASGVDRTDVIALRYDPTYTGAPGPVRLIRIAGTSSAVPAYDATPPGVEDLPLWAVTRKPGQALNLATVVRMFPRRVPMLVTDANAPLPLDSPQGTHLRRGTQKYIRTIDSSFNPVWQLDSIATNPVALSLLSGVNNAAASLKPVSYWREEKTAFAVGSVDLSAPMAGLATKAVGDLPVGFRPIGGTITASTSFDSRFEVLTSGRINLINGRLQELPKEVVLPLHLIIPLG